MILFCVLASSVACAQELSTPTQMPDLAKTMDDSSFILWPTVFSLTLEYSRPSTLIYVNGPKAMEFFDKNGKSVLTIYVDGHVDSEFGAAASESAQAFWKQFAQAYNNSVRATCVKETK